MNTLINSQVEFNTSLNKEYNKQPYNWLFQYYNGCESDIKKFINEFCKKYPNLITDEFDGGGVTPYPEYEALWVCGIKEPSDILYVMPVGDSQIEDGVPEEFKYKLMFAYQIL